MIKGLGYFLLGFASFTTTANTTEQELRNMLAKYDGYTASFDQEVKDVQGTLLHKAQGTMSFEQPGKFIWQVTEPEEEVLTSNGNTVWWYNPFVEQVSIFDSQQAVDKTPFALLVSQDDQTWAQFDISKEDNDFVVASKSDSDAAVRELRIRFDGDKLSKILILDRSMQTSEYRIEQQTFMDIEDSQFNFVIPDDTEIDDQRQLSSDSTYPAGEL